MIKLRILVNIKSLAVVKITFYSCSWCLFTKKLYNTQIKQGKNYFKRNFYRVGEKPYGWQKHANFPHWNDVTAGFSGILPLKSPKHPKCMVYSFSAR